MNKTIYLDYNATTPLDPRVFEVMLPYFKEDFGNSVSAAHAFGWNAEKAVESARKQVAKFLNCQASEIFFTAGATESNNWVIRGLMDRLRREDASQKIEIISSPLEHSSVTKSLRWAESQGAKIHWTKVNSKGELDLSEVKSLINENTKLMSFMWVNNEIGTINPMDELVNLALENKVYLHTDATQAFGKVVVDLQKTPVDLLSFSAHKIYGPKGIGVLMIKAKNPKVQIDPLMHGGGHERGFRSGTVNVPAVVGLGKACELIGENQTEEMKKMRELQNSFWNDLLATFPQSRLNGPSLGDRACNNLNVSFCGMRVPPSFAEIAVSRGSACHSGIASVSPVLRAIGLDSDVADQTLRLSMGRWTTSEELKDVLRILQKSLV